MCDVFCNCFSAKKIQVWAKTAELVFAVRQDAVAAGLWYLVSVAFLLSDSSTSVSWLRLCWHGWTEGQSTPWQHSYCDTICTCALTALGVNCTKKREMGQFLFHAQIFPWEVRASKDRIWPRALNGLFVNLVIYLFCRDLCAISVCFFENRKTSAAGVYQYRVDHHVCRQWDSLESVICSVLLA